MVNDEKLDFDHENLKASFRGHSNIFKKESAFEDSFNYPPNNPAIGFKRLSISSCNLDPEKKARFLKSYFLHSEGEGQKRHLELTPVLFNTSMITPKEFNKNEPRTRNS
jgi:hypothetical protein